MAKRVNERRAPKNKRIRNPENFSTESELCVWTFKYVDRDVKFAFNPSRQDFDAEDFLTKLLEYSKMAWCEIKRQTHDGGKSKHHELSQKTLSKDAMSRITAKNLEEKTDTLFSFALNNKVRVIGLRNGAEFQAIWYDAEHEFAPSSLKHT